MGDDGQLPTDVETYSLVESRNQIRQQSGLPLVELQQELDRIQKIREHQAFEHWMQSPLRYRVEQKLLLRIRRQRKNPDWRPTGMLSGSGLAFHTVLFKQMRRLAARLGG